MPSDPLKKPKNLSPHCMPVKVLGHTNLHFFIPARLTALLIGRDFSAKRSVSVSYKSVSYVQDSTVSLMFL